MDGQELLMYLLPDAGNWQVVGIAFETQTGSLTVEPRTKRPSGVCPNCQQVPRHVHSWYKCTVVDLLMAEWAVKLRMHVRRFRWRNENCVKQVFTEHIPQVVAPSSR